jgi:beta-lactam-binding protein with PASTA domain
MPGVFISYRREDSAGHTGRLFDRLRARLGHDRVFMDITGIEAGVDFVDTIERAIGSCDVLLAVIGPEWLSCSDVRGRPRLEDPNDLIRIEIAAALTRKVRVIPVLIAGASMPSAQSLPEDLKPLARRQAAELRDTRWDADTNDLVAVLERLLPSSSSVQSAPTSASSSRRPEVVPRPAAAHDAGDRRRVRRLAAAALTVSALAAVAILFSNPSFLGSNFETNPLTRLLNQLRPATETASQGDGSRNVAAPVAVPRPPAEGVGVHVEGSSPTVAAPLNVAKTTRVPKVEGVTLRLAAQALRDAGLAVGTQESVSAPGVSPFVVTKQTPAAGSFVPRDGRVNLIYARPMRTLPAVTNRALDEAIAELRESGFEPGLLTARPTDKAPAQQVLEQSHPPGVELEPGTKIDLVYAAPPSRLTVPNIVGLDLTAASSKLQQVGLVVSSRRYRPTVEVPAGQVMSQDPQPGAFVEKGSGVAIVYASRRGLKVPNVQNVSTQEARTILERSGFTAKITYEATDRAKADTVIRQFPSPDSASMGDKPVVELVVARALSLTSTLGLLIHYNTEAEREIAQGLSTYLAGYKFASNRIVQVNGRSSLMLGGVHYARSEHERLAQSLASRAQSWFSKTYNRSIMLTPRLEPRVRGDLIIIYLPGQN